MRLRKRKQKVQNSVEAIQIKPQAKVQVPPIQIAKPKPKKYMKKTINEKIRIEKSKNQRIYLLKAEKGQKSWSFAVEGTTGSNYHVDISTSVQCTCMDYRMKQKPCKHIYFIITQVAQNEQLLDFFKNDTRISKSAFDILDLKLQERLRSRLQKIVTQQKKDIDLKDDTDCPICFCQMEKETEDLDDCGRCKKFFHLECIKVWKRKNPTCPLCRNNFVEAKPLIMTDNKEDALGKLSQIVI